MDKTIDRWTDPDGNGYAFKDTVARAQNRATIDKMNTETADRKSELDIERKRIDNLIKELPATAGEYQQSKLVLHSYDNTAVKCTTTSGNYTNVPAFTTDQGGPLSYLYTKKSNYQIAVNKSGLYLFELRIHVNSLIANKRVELAPFVNDTRIAALVSSYNTAGSFTLTQIAALPLWLSANDTVDFKIAPIDAAEVSLQLGDVLVYAIDWEDKFKIPDYTGYAAETKDIRTGADGTVYGTAGEAVRKQIGNLTEDITDIDYIVFKDKINKLTFNSEGTSSNIALNGNRITSINAAQSQYKAFINTSLFEDNKKYKVIAKITNNGSTSVKVYMNAFSHKFEGSIGRTNGLDPGKTVISETEYTGVPGIRGFSIYSTTENASYAVDIYVYDVTNKYTSNIVFSVGGTKIKILKSDLEKPYFGKKLCTYGDSITAQQTWQDYVQRELGFSKYYNHGVGGRRLMEMATDECLAEITEDFDVMLVMGGTNDWAQDRTIGTENDINTDDQAFTGTFYGGLNALMKKLLVKYPTKRIAFMTQTPVKNRNGEAFFNKKGSADGLKNSNGDTTRDFARATLNACGNKHVPCVDLNSLVGWNENNISSFVKNENDMFFHPTSIGGKRMAECISGFLKSIQSIN